MNNVFIPSLRKSISIEEFKTQCKTLVGKESNKLGSVKFKQDIKSFEINLNFIGGEDVDSIIENVKKLWERVNINKLELKIVG